jgi:PAS domain S-box-containing protein
MESLDYGVYDWDLDASRVYISPTLAIMLGLPTDNLIHPANWATFVHPDDLPVYRRMMIAYLKGEAARFECDYRYRSGDGTWRWIRQHGVAERAPDGHVCRMVGAARDITEIRQHARELQSAKAEVAAAHRLGAAEAPAQDVERYALAMESLSHGLYDWDLETGTIYYSPSLRIVLGLSASELSIPEDWTERIHPADLPLFQRTLAEHLKGETARFECEVRYRTGDGTWRWARQHARTGACGAWWGRPATSPRSSSASASCTAPRPPSPIRARSRRRTSRRTASATRSRWSRSTNTSMTGTSRPTRSICRRRCAPCSACRPRRRSPTGPTASIPTTGCSTGA